MTPTLTRRKRRALAEMNLVPYIDVMLVLLIIFMMTAPTLQQGIDVSLPQIEAGSAPVAEEIPLIATINAKGQYYLEYPKKTEGPLPLAHMKSKLREYMQYHTKTQVLIKGDARVDYGQVVLLMAELQTLGLDSVGLMTEPVN